MRYALIAAAVILASCSKPGAEADGSSPASTPPSSVSSGAYAPMAAFAPFSGKTFRGEWTDDEGSRLVDIAKWELILNGRALQSTHRLEGGDYGGRTIFFYDEAAKKYVFHYFTTAGFHTSGVAEFVDGALVTNEKVEGHDTIASVRSVVAFKADVLELDVIYVGKDGSEMPGGHRIYKEIAGSGRLFADTL
ncbi:MAG: hypothetical protein R3C42_03645 [Parvularculaceae bacterium]|nr:hypothetical protein [Parvularculaceae bacterium]